MAGFRGQSGRRLGDGDPGLIFLLAVLIAAPGVSYVATLTTAMNAARAGSCRGWWQQKLATWSW